MTASYVSVKEVFHNFLYSYDGKVLFVRARA